MRRLCVWRNSPKAPWTAQPTVRPPRRGHKRLPGRQAPAETASHNASFWALTLGSVGVVYGDIGTSPLYAFREAVVAAQAGGPVTREIVLGVLSLIVWSLIVVVTLKYIVLLLRMDNNGEGGTLSLTALAFRAVGRRALMVLMLGVIGAAMFYGSSLITPALSVLVGGRGLKVVDTGVRTLRAADHDRAAGRAVCSAVARYRASCGAVRPDHGRIWFIAIDDMRRTAYCRRSRRAGRDQSVLCDHVCRRATASIGLITLGAVFLVVTGSEALYADLGHFGRKPIQTAWFYLVLPALLINYFGQGALVLYRTRRRSTIRSIVSCPDMLLLPMVVLGDGRRPSSRARRSSPAPIRSPIRRSSSGCCRGSRFATLRRRCTARSTCRA